MTTTSGLTLTIPVENGELYPTDYQRHLISKYLETREGKEVVVTYKRPTNRRSLSQNRFYWGTVLAIIATETGHTAEEVHGALKALMLPRKFITIGKREIEVAKTTTELSTEEFESYLERVRAWASSELGINIPTPNE